MMAVVLAVFGAFLVVGTAVIARHRAQSGADLAALAAAGRLATGHDAACAWAVRVVGESGAQVTSCTVQGLDVVITVDVHAALGRWGLGAARAAARAGPG
jgi:secretion/DNA translocation related TadE-like protein